MKELYRFIQFLNEDKKGSFRNKFSKGSGSEEYNNFETYYERWEDEWAKPGNAMVFDFDDEDEWGDYKGGKVASHTWEIGYEEEDDHYAPIINNMLNYLEKNKTYSYKNDDGINVKFEIYNPGSIDMEIYYTTADIKKYKNKFNNYDDLKTPDPLVGLNDYNIMEDVSSRFINKYLSMVTPENFKDIEDIESYSDRDKAIFMYLEIVPGIMVGDELARDLKNKPGEEIVGYFKDKNYSYMPYSAMDKTFGSKTPTGMEFERGQPEPVHLDRTHNMRINKILRSEYPDVIDFMKSDRTGGNAIDVHNAIQDRYSDEAKDGRSREVSYEEYASDFADAMMNRAAGNLNENKSMEFNLQKYLAEGRLLKEEEIDVLGNEFLQDIQGEMKRMYSMDVDMDDIKDWVQMYYIGYNSEYDEGPGDVDYEGNEFGSEDYESEKKEPVFDTGEREDFYTYIEDYLD